MSDIVSFMTFFGSSTVLIYQLRESSLVPSGFLIAQFLRESAVYEAFVVMGELAL